jgi:hypothetical protein
VRSAQSLYLQMTLERDAYRSGDRIQTEINYLLWEVGFFVCPYGIPRVRLRIDGTGIGVESDTGTGGGLLGLRGFLRLPESETEPLPIPV